MKAKRVAIVLLSMLTQVYLCGCDAVLQVSGHVVDSRQKFIEGAEVTISPGAGSDVKLPPYSCISDDTGGFSMPVIYSPHAKNPVFKLEVSKKGYTREVPPIHPGQFRPSGSARGQLLGGRLVTVHTPASSRISVPPRIT